jgi:hypothetical protein
VKRTIVYFLAVATLLKRSDENPRHTQTNESTNTETTRPNDYSIGSDKINIDKVNQVVFKTNNYVKYSFWYQHPIVEDPEETAARWTLPLLH